jgi:hypothetical protein
MLVGCSAKDTKKVKDDASEFVSDVKENLDEMIDNATVSDGDGHIGDENREKSTETRDEATEETVTGAGVVDDNGALLDDPTEAEETTAAEDFI